MSRACRSLAIRGVGSNPLNFRYPAFKKIAAYTAILLSDGLDRIFFANRSIVILKAKVSYKVFTLHMPQRILQFHQLNEYVMLGI